MNLLNICPLEVYIPSGGVHLLGFEYPLKIRSAFSHSYLLSLTDVFSATLSSRMFLHEATLAHLNAPTNPFCFPLPLMLMKEMFENPTLVTLGGHLLGHGQ